MKNKILVTFLSLIASTYISMAQIPTNLQTISKPNFPKNTQYLLIKPQEKIKDVIILFPGLFDHPYSIFFETDLVQKSVKEGHLIMIPILSKDNDKFDLTDESMNNLSVLINDLFKSNLLADTTSIVIGGFSIGGTRALSYYRYAKQKKIAKNIKRVFAIDPPLDLVRLIAIKGEERDIITKTLGREMNKSDFSSLDSLKKYSIYLHLGNLPYPKLGNTRIKIFSESNIQWHLKKHQDLYDMNIIDIVGFVNLLKSEDESNQINLILSQDKGLRKQTNEINPHSWSLLDVKVFLDWIKK